MHVANEDVEGCAGCCCGCCADRKDHWDSLVLEGYDREQCERGVKDASLQKHGDGCTKNHLANFWCSYWNLSGANGVEKVAQAIAYWELQDRAEGNNYGWHNN